LLFSFLRRSHERRGSSFLGKFLLFEGHPELVALSKAVSPLRSATALHTVWMKIEVRAASPNSAGFKLL
jgi:hypothetical protein